MSVSVVRFQSIVYSALHFIYTYAVYCAEYAVDSYGVDFEYAVVKTWPCRSESPFSTTTVKQPVTSKHLPHLAHHHHFGWNAPTPEVSKTVVMLCEDHKPVWLRAGSDVLSQWR